MSSTRPAAPTDPPPDATPEEIEAHIQESRERLASTVDALTTKLNVKEQAKQKARGTSAQAKQKARETSERVRSGAQHAYEQGYERARTTSPTVLGGIAAGAVGLVVLVIVLWRRLSDRS
jgi:hypothetical protein